MATDPSRRQKAFQVRVSAAEIARERTHPIHIANGDELRFRNGPKENEKPPGKSTYLVSYTKGLPHCEKTGLVLNPAHVEQFIRAIDSGDARDFRDTPLGAPENVGDTCWDATQFGLYWKSDKAQNGAEPVPVRAWESQGAGNTYDLEGPDAQAVTMPPAPRLGSDELTAEMGEIYLQAWLRDVPFTALACGTNPGKAHTEKVNKALTALNKLKWFAGDDCCRSAEERARSRGKFFPHTAFRGITKGDDVGPYISQFLLAGNKGINGNDDNSGLSNASGYVAYGGITIEQKVRQAVEGDDHMTLWPEWYDVQNGADLRRKESYVDGAYRFITTPRDLATYVHYDALYEAYLNACLIMLGEGIPFDPGLPFQESDIGDHQQGFAHFGGPHILSLVTEVATRALKAVRYQKFNIHRRCRPEALAARIEKESILGNHYPEITHLKNDLQASGILPLIRTRNAQLNTGAAPTDKSDYLLPMAFCEGSPMHPSYGAGHATVAGACVTILKAFFDHSHELAIAGSSDKAFVPNADGSELVTVSVKAPKKGNPAVCVNAKLTVEGELNKLASNISIGRDWAGVHYFTDYIESVRMGEKIAIGILEEQKITYGENFSMTVPLFDGGTIRI